MRLYLAGTVTGSNPNKIIDQSYRKTLNEILKNNAPNVEVDDPQEGYADGLTYVNSRAVTAFEDCVERASKADIVLAYMPEVSLGTIIECWEAHKAEKEVIIITPLYNSWAVLSTATEIFSNIDDFKQHLEAGYFKW